MRVLFTGVVDKEMEDDIRRLGGEVVGVAGIIDLPELGGSAKLRAAGLNVHTLCEFNETE